MFRLRDYQELLIDGCRIEFQNGKKRVCVCSPCGSGKTIIMTYMAAQAKTRGQNTLFVVHRQELTDQSSEAFKKMGIPHGIIAAGYSMNTSEAIQVASIQSVIRRFDKIKEPQLIILDEAQHSTAGTWRKLLNTYPNAYVVGLTATPWRMGGQGLGDVFESLVIGPSVKDLISWGNLAPYRYYAPPVAVDFDDIKVRYGDYDHAEVALRMDKSEIIGDLVQQYQKLAPGSRAVCYCASIPHSQHTAQAFRDAGINAIHIDGETNKDIRKAAINDFRSGKIQVLTNMDLISEGLDIPAMDTVILARPTQSLTLYIQQAFRALRSDPNNPDKIATIIDHVGNVYRHGLPDEDREWSLEGKKKKASAPRDFALKQCPKCYSAHRPGPVCPYCKHVYQVAEREEPERKDGGLAEIIELEKKKKKEEVKKAKDVVTLEQIAMQRGYAPGWVRKMCELKRIRFGGSK